MYKITRFNYWVMVVLEGGERSQKGGLPILSKCKQGGGGVQMLVIL